MKKLKFILLPIMTMSQYSYSQNLNMDGLDNSKNACAFIFKMSKSLMEGRQNGMNIVKMKTLFNVIELPEGGKEFFDFATNQAYAEPIQNSEELKDAAIDKFANDMALMCYNSVENNSY